MTVCLLVLALLQDDEVPNWLREPHVFAKADVWYASIESSGRLERWFGNKGSGEEKDPRMSFHREGRLGDPAAVAGIELAVVAENAKHEYIGGRICVRYGAWSESGSVDDDFSIDGTMVPAGSPFHSRFRYQSYSLGVIGGWRPSRTPVELWGWIGCHLHREDFDMQTVSGTLKDGAGGIGPELGGHAEVHPVPFLFVAGEFSIMPFLGVPETQVMICAGATWAGVRLEAGYRHLWAAWDPDPDFRLSMGGPFVGLSARF